MARPESIVYRLVALRASLCGLLNRNVWIGKKVILDRASLAGSKAVLAISGLSVLMVWGVPPQSTSVAHAQTDSPALVASSPLYSDAVRAIENNDIAAGLAQLEQAAEAGETRALLLYHTLVDVISDAPQAELTSRIRAATDDITTLPENALGHRAYDFALASVAAENGSADADRAIALLEAAATSGFPRALLQLGYVYQRGQGVDPDANRAVRYFQQAGEAGVPAALIQLGIAYRNGEGVDVDGPRAIDYFERAVAAGSTAALVQLGITYRDGRGVEPDAARAIDYFEQAAEAGVGAALTQLGITYRDGRGVEADAGRAFRYFEQAAKAGVPAAFVELGVAYRNGVGVAADGAQAVNYFQQAAEAGLPIALIQLGITYRDGRGVEADPERAIDYFEQAAEADFPAAFVQLGVTYRDGRGVAADAARAAFYFARAADAGVPMALMQLGIAYRDGRGVVIDADRALDHLQQAAQAGLPAALVEIGIAHRDGIGMDPSTDRALEYFEQAASQGVSSGASEALTTWMAQTERNGGVELLTRYLDLDFGDEGRWLARVYRTLTPNERTELIQLLLNANGRPVAIDGLFGAETIVAVQEVCSDLAAAGCRGALLTVETIRLLHRAYVAGT